MIFFYKHMIVILLYHPCFDMQSSHEQTTPQYFPAVAMPSRKKRKRSSCPFFKRCIIILRPTFAKQRKCSSDYASRSPSSIRRAQDGFERRATTHSLAGYIICLGWCLVFLMLFWPIHKPRYQSEE